MTVTTREFPRTIHRLGLVAITGATTLLVWFVATLLGLNTSVTMIGATQQVAGASVLVATVAAALAAWAVKALLERVALHLVPAAILIPGLTTRQADTVSTGGGYGGTP